MYIYNETIAGNYYTVVYPIDIENGLVGGVYPTISTHIEFTTASTAQSINVNLIELGRKDLSGTSTEAILYLTNSTGFDLTVTDGVNVICIIPNGAMSIVVIKYDGSNTVVTKKINTPIQSDVTSIGYSGTPHNLTNADSIVLVDSTTESKTIYLPSAPIQGSQITIKDATLTASINNIVIDGNGHNIVVFVEDATQSITTNGTSVTLIYSGTKWYCI